MSKTIISILFVMIFSISAFGESYSPRRVNPNQNAQISNKSATKPAKRTTSTKRTTNTKSAKRTTNAKPTKSAKSRLSTKNLSSIMKAKTASGPSATTITLSSIGGVALAGGVGGGIYALVKDDKKSPSNSNETKPTLITTSIGVVDSGFDSEQIPIPSKNFYNVGVTPGESDTGHGTIVARAIRHHNTTSNLYMYSARCGEREICLSPDMYSAMYERGVKVINASWGRTEDINSLTISPYYFGTYYSSPIHYDMAKEAATSRIFVFAAGNEKSRHASMQGSLPLIATKLHTGDQAKLKVWENARRGWIVATAIYWKESVLDTRYANWIGKEAQNFGIAVLPYESRTGTSFSAPIVTAVAANVWNQFPWMSNHLVTQTILSTADKYTVSDSDIYGNSTGDKWHKNEVTNGPNKKTGWGVLNENRALKGPARFDKRLLVAEDNEMVQINLSAQNYDDLNRLTFSNDIAGDAGVHKYGSGLLYMSGKNTYTGETHIDDGGIVISNALRSSKVTINANGTLRTQNLGFVGSAQPNVVTLGTPNTSYTLTNYGRFEVLKDTTLNGNYIGSENATLGLNVNALLSVNGSVDMKGGGFAFHSLNEIPSTNLTTKTLLTAQKGIKEWSGSWSVAQDSSAFLKISEVKLATQNALSVTYGRNSTKSIVSKALGYTPQNLRNVAYGIDSALDSLAQNTAQSAVLAESIETQPFDAQSSETQPFDANSTTQGADSTNPAFYAEALSLLALTQENATNGVASLSGEIYDSNLSRSEERRVGKEC